MAIDREETLRKAEKLLRQGRLDAAIAEYARVAETHPGDLATVNKLGELYQRAGQTAEAITCFGRVADHWLTEGLHAKAASHYKKILKLNPQDESAMLQLVEATAQQGLLTEAKAHLRAALDRRIANGDARGADDLRLRLADLDPNDFEAWLDGLRLRVRDNPEADLAPVLRDAIAKLDRQGRTEEADILTLSVIDLDPDDVAARVRAARAAMRRGDRDEARAVLLDPETSESYDVVLIAAELALAEPESAPPTGADAGAETGPAATEAGDEGSAGGTTEGAAAIGRAAQRRVWFERLLAIDRVRAAEDIGAFADRLAPEDVDAAYGCVEVLADHHAAAGQFRPATDLVLRFLSASPRHLPALLRLVELCVDGDFEAELTDAQTRLADVYLDVGQALQARVISEDLLSRDPQSAAHRDRLRRALVALGDADPDTTIAELLGFAEEDALGVDLFAPTPAPPPSAPPIEEPDFDERVVSPEATFGVDAPLDGLETPWTGDESPTFQPPDLAPLAVEPVLPEPPVPPAPAVAPPPPVPPPPSTDREPIVADSAVADPAAVEAAVAESTPAPVKAKGTRARAKKEEESPQRAGKAGASRKSARQHVESIEQIDLSREIDLTAALNALAAEEDAADALRADTPGRQADGSAPQASDPVAADVVPASGSDTDIVTTAPSSADEEGELDTVFEGLRQRAADHLAELPPTDQSVRLLRMADTYQAAGMLDEARAALEQAAADPRSRFRAALALGRLLWREHRTADAIAWLERASEAPAPTPDDGRAVRYELAERLEATGETTRALAVLLDLVAEQEDYRDARARIDRLVRAEAE